jgi:hypothetical protein
MRMQLLGVMYISNWLSLQNYKHKLIRRDHNLPQVFNLGATAPVLLAP